jgi:hypothetical protein
MRWVMLLTSALMVLFIGPGAVAQSASRNSDSVLARLSYQTGSPVIDWRNQEGSPRMCLAVYQKGYFQISRLTEHGNETLEGAMPKGQLGKLQGLLHEVDFQSQGDGIVLQGAESLVVEVLRHGKTKHYFWINSDDRNPLPTSALKVVNWLMDFQARGAIPFKHYEASDIRICPSMNDNPLPLTSSLK